MSDLMLLGFCVLVVAMHMYFVSPLDRLPQAPPLQVDPLAEALREKFER